MKKKLISWIAVLLVIMIPLSGMADSGVTANAQKLSFSTTTLEGKAISSSIIAKYDLVLVNFWGTWCGWCVWEMPYLQQLHENYPNVLILGVWDEYGSVEEAISKGTQNGVTYPLIRPSGMLSTLLRGITGFPTSYFFDRNGNQIGDADVGARDYSAWVSTVEEKLAQIPKVTKPVISSQPKSVSVKAGKKATFKLTAKGDGLTYQWYYRTSSKASWKKISGATSAKYTFTAKTSKNGYQYRCLVKNSAGKVYSKTVKLTVKK